ncbi:hypothetical protein ACFWUP_25860 [Nocardia sp. NPDC058658]|uniref:hypothetical protein n=1 Tax=Nocardia sp. NPDC058658 TaxID=3346580 RepID=UPI003660891C
MSTRMKPPPIVSFSTDGTDLAQIRQRFGEHVPVETRVMFQRNGKRRRPRLDCHADRRTDRHPRTVANPSRAVRPHDRHRPFSEFADFHGLRIVYEGDIRAGELRNETDGSTDLAARHPLTDVEQLDRVDLVDIGIELWRTKPALGRVRD